MTARSFSMMDVLLDAEPLSQVIFIHDYIQLVFQDIYFNLYNRASLHRSGCTLRVSDIGFADELRRPIGQRVVDTTTEEKQFTAITFESGVQVSGRAEPLMRCVLTAACHERVQERYAP